MENIFPGSLIFLLATAALAYVPGALLLLSLKRPIMPLERVTLACVLGLIVSGGVYWLLGFVHLFDFYFLWPLTVVLTLAYLVWHRRRRVGARVSPLENGSVPPPRDFSLLLLVAIVALGGVVLALLPQYYTNLTWRKDGTMKVFSVDDVFLHLAIANELTHTIPPQTPVFAGYPLTYHYGMDLSVAMFATTTHLETRDLTLRFMPTLFLTLSMLIVFCFSRRWFGSGYFASLMVLLVFFGEDFSFIPGLLQGEKIDWSVVYFQEPTVFSLFFSNPMLPALGLFFGALFCLQSYLREKSYPWLIFAALLLTALLEVKVFTAAQIMLSLGLVSLVYLFRFRDAHLFKVAALTAILTIPLILAVFLANRSGADIVITPDPWPYVSLAMKRLSLETLSAHWFSFIVLAVPLYFAGCLGLRALGLWRVLCALVHPRKDFALDCVLAWFVLIGALITMFVRIVPAGFTEAFNNGGWFLVQSKYVAWIFAVEALRDSHNWALRRGAPPTVVAFATTVVAITLSVPTTVYHFICELRRTPFPTIQTYDSATVRAMRFVARASHPGDVVLSDSLLSGPIITLTKCRVPLGYFSSGQVSSKDYTQRTNAEAEFWRAWCLGRVKNEFLRQARVQLIVVNKQLEGAPKSLPPELSQSYANAELAVFRVDLDRLVLTTPASIQLGK